jgi:hypothetical protein
VSRSFSQSIHQRVELYAVRFGVRSFEFTAAWQILNAAGPYFNAWAEAQGVVPVPGMPMHVFVGALSTMTALYEAGTRYRCPFFPTFSELGIRPHPRYVEPERAAVEDDFDRDFVRDNAELPWSK